VLGHAEQLLALVAEVHLRGQLAAFLRMQAIFGRLFQGKPLSY
jgi:hypothetical protein